MPALAHPAAPAPPATRRTWQARLASAARGPLRRNTLAGSAAAAGNFLVSALSYRLYLHHLGYERYGLWLSVAVVLSAAQFGNLGIAPAVTREVARQFAAGNRAAIQDSLSTAVLVLGAAGFLIALAVLALSRPIVGLLRLDPAASALALRLLPAAALLSIYVLQVDAAGAALTGLGRLDLAMATQFASRVLTLALAAALLASGFGVFALPAAAFFGYAALHAAAVILIRRRIGRSPIRLSAFSFPTLKRLAAFGSGVSAISFFSFLIAPLNRVFLASFAGAASVPVFDLAWSLALGLRSFLDSGLRAVMPEAARLSALTPLSPDVPSLRLSRLRRRALLFAAAAGVLLFGSVALAAPPLLRAWLGARFTPDLVPAARILLAGAFVSLLGVPAYYTLLGSAQLKRVAWSHALMAAFNVALVAVAAAFFSLTPARAAAAAAAGMLASTIYLLKPVRPLRSGLASPFPIRY